jgi:AraC-like DNA-binding protein
MQAVPLARTSSIRPLVDFLERGGADLQRLLERVQPALGEADSLIPVAYGGTLFEEAARASGMDDLGLRLGQDTRIETFGEWGSLLARSPTVAAFLEISLASYRRFNTGYRLWTVVRGDEVWLHQAYTRLLRLGRQPVRDLSLVLWLKALRKLLGPAWRPLEIHLEDDPPRYAGELRAMAARAIRFQQPTTAIVFPRADLARRVPALAVRPVRSPLSPAADFVGSVRQTVASLLQLGVLQLGLAAEAAGMSERSFQRHLSEAGLTYSELVEGARFEAAARLLADPAVKVIDVSTQLGYSDSANFTRAFRRWSGVSPQLFRRVSRSGPVAATP